MSQNKPIRKRLLFLLPLIIMPLLSYTIYQIVQRNRQQVLIQSIYQQQLDGILLSINQNSWDRLNVWTGQLSGMVQSRRPEDHNQLDRELARFLERYPAVVSLAIYTGRERLAAAGRAQTDSIQNASQPGLSDSLRTVAVSAPSGSSSSLSIDDTTLQKVLSDSSQRIERMFELAAQNYIRPIAVAWQPEGYTLLLAPLSRTPAARGSGQISAALLIDQLRYVDETVSVRMRETGRDLFDFAVSNRRSGEFLYASAAIPPAEFEQTTPLWILPDLELLIKLRGLTLTELAGRQARVNLIFLLAVNVVLLLGVGLMIRSMVREMELVRQKTDFVANVSHELRTPLALIRMYAETLELDRVPDEARRRQYYRTIMNESARLTQLINNILDFARIEARQKVYHFREEELVGIVNDILEVYRFHMEQKGFSLKEELEENLPMVSVDREAVELALVNLLDNAIKYSGEVKEIRVRLERRGQTLQLSVADRGIGISGREQSRIFAKFYRVESSLVRNTSGSGLGLSLVEHIAQVHGGHVEVESELGRGSRFTLVFPLAGNGSGP